MASSASIAMPPSRWLPLWSILEMDFKQTVKSWLYRIAIFSVVIVSVGVLLNRASIHREVGRVQFASDHVGDFLQYTVIFGAAVAALFASSAIAGERGNLIDSTLCRGVGRWHYFLGKWIARSLAVVCGFFGVCSVFMLATVFILKSDLDFDHCLVAMLLVASILFMMVSIAMSISASVNNTMLCLGLVLFVLYGVMAVLWLVPFETFTLSKFLNTLPMLVRTDEANSARGAFYKAIPLLPFMKLSGYIALTGCGLAGAGMLYFMRKDV